MAASFAFCAIFLFANALFGFYLRRTRTENELMNMMSREGFTGERLTAAKQVSTQILYPHRFVAFGLIFALLALVFLAVGVSQSP
jgi:ammonia channel protein AmtB